MSKPYTDDFLYTNADKTKHVLGSNLNKLAEEGTLTSFLEKNGTMSEYREGTHIFGISKDYIEIQGVTTELVENYRYFITYFNTDVKEEKTGILMYAFMKLDGDDTNIRFFYFRETLDSHFYTIIKESTIRYIEGPLKPGDRIDPSTHLLVKAVGGRRHLRKSKKNRKTRRRLSSRRHRTLRR